MLVLSNLKSRCIIALFVVGLPLPLFSQSIIDTVHQLNLGFEKLNEKKLPIHVKWQSDGGRYKVSIDSLNRAKGKYSIQLQSVKSPKGGHMSFVDILFQLRGDYLKNKKVLITAYLKLKNVNLGSASLWYDTYPPPHLKNSVNRLFYGDMNLKGSVDWKKYRLVFHTDSLTKRLSFGAYLFGEGKVNVDHFKIYLNGTPIDSFYVRKGMIINSENGK